MQYKKNVKLNKDSRKIKSMFDKASDGLNLMITNRIKILDLIDNLIDLKIISEEI